MRIQEMKSGFVHLRKKMDDDGRENISKQAVAEPVKLPVTLPVCELDEPHWSVISFAQAEAGGLTFAQATALIAELELYDFPGLCIVTDEAAARINLKTPTQLSQNSR